MICYKNVYDSLQSHKPVIYKFFILIFEFESTIAFFDKYLQ